MAAGSRSGATTGRRAEFRCAGHRAGAASLALDPAKSRVRERDSGGCDREARARRCRGLREGVFEAANWSLKVIWGIWGGDNLANAVGVAVDGEVKAPVVIDAGLLTAFGFIERLGAERRLRLRTKKLICL